MRRRVLMVVVSLSLAATLSSVAAPAIKSILPAQAPRGAHVLILGTELGDPQSGVTFTGPGGTLPPISISRTATAIEVRVPETAITGPLHVGGASAPFSVAADPGFVKTATIATGLKQPNAVAFGDGVLYVADTLHHQIRAIGLDASSRIVAGTGNPALADGPALNAAFKEPAGIAVDVQHSIVYVADTGNNVLRRINADGTVATLAGSGRPEDADGTGSQAGFKQPTAIALDADGNLIVADTGNSKIKKVTATGVVTMIAGSGKDGRADGPAFDALFSHPQGVAIMSDGSILVADTQNNLIRRIANGAVTTFAGTGHAGLVNGPVLAAEFSQPCGIALDDGGNVFIADSQNHVIREVSDGTVTTVAGTGKPGLTDGAPQSAQFNHPSGVAFAGALIVADALNDAIRVLYAAPRLTAIEPRIGPIAGGNQIRLFGAAFVAGATRVWIGDTQSTAVVYVSSTELLVTVPAGNAGSVDVRVTTDGGTAFLEQAYTYAPPPTIFSIAPNKGKTAGGDPVTVLGTDFIAAETNLSIGGNQANACSVETPSLLTAVTPSGSAGAANVSVTTPGGHATAPLAFTYFAPPTIAGFSPLSGITGSSVTVIGNNFDPDASGNRVSFGALDAQVVSATPTTLSTRVPAGAQTAPIRVTTAGGAATSGLSFTAIQYTAFTVTPTTVQLTTGESKQLAATATRSDGTQLDVTQSAVWSSSNISAATVAAGLVQSAGAGSAMITATLSGFTATSTVTVTAGEPLPPDPVTVAPPINLSTATSYADSIRFLYTGSNPIQRAVAVNAIDEKRVAVLRGRILDRDAHAVSGVRISVLGNSQLGYTLSRTDGWFDLAANGGGPIVLQYQKDGYIPVQRTISSDWHRFATASDVVMTPYDARVTAIDLANATRNQLAQGSMSHDSDGDRHAAILFAPGTEASMVLPDGSNHPLTTLHVRATEYTVGPNGPQAMPAALPPQSAYTYCAELSVDEAVAAGATTVTFSQPVILYVNNFLGFPAGEPVPVGYYDRTRGVWVPMPNGRIIAILSTAGGVASIDIDGDGRADDQSMLDELGITVEEQATLGATYSAGQSLWRVALPHFTSIDLNWNQIAAVSGAAADAKPPKGRSPGVDVQPDDTCRCSGSIVECQSQALGETLPITGTPFALTYSSARQKDRVAARTAEITLTDDTVPPNVQSVDLTIDIAGQHIKRSFSPAANLKDTLVWDGKDVYGRQLQGAQDLSVTVSYVYPTVYRTVPRQFAEGFALANPSGAELRAGRTAGTLSAETHATLRPLDARGLGLGGWTVDIHHTLDVEGNQLLRGDGTKRTASSAPAGTITTVAGSAVSSTCGSIGGPATSACLSSPNAVAVAADGTFYVANTSTVFRINPQGRIFVFANNLSIASGIAVARDGSVYISDRGNNQIRRVDPNGVNTRFAGALNDFGFPASGFSGDGGPATDALLKLPTDIAVSADGSVYFVDSGNNRVRRIATDGTIATVAGNGVFGLALDGVAATASPLQLPVGGIAVGPDGTLYVPGGRDRIARITPDGIIRSFWQLGNPSFCDTFSCSVSIEHLAVSPLDGALYASGRVSNHFTAWRINPDASFTTIADGPNSPVVTLPTDQFFGGDGGLATAAKYGQPAGLAVAPDGAVLVSDTYNRRVRRIEPIGARQSSGQLQLAAENGSEVYVFDSVGRHLKTLDAFLGQPIYQFTYDPAGRLASVVDLNGNTTTLERDATGNLSAIVAPGGQRTTLTTGANGYLATIANPAGETVHTTFTSGGLLAGMTDARGKDHAFNYDPTGRLIVDAGPAGGSQSLSMQRTSNDNFTLTRATALGRVTTYGTEHLATGETRQTRINAAGLMSATTTSTDGTLFLTQPNGMAMTVTRTADPRFRAQTPLMQSLMVRTPSGRSMVANLTRTATLGDPTNPLSMTRLTDVVQIGGKNWTNAFDRGQRSITSTSPLGRQSIVTVDEAGRPTQTSIPGVSPLMTSYDFKGRPSSTTQAGRTTTLTWDDANRLTSVSDTLHRSTQFDYDNAGRVVAQRFSDGRTVRYTWDQQGNLLSLTPSGRPAHTFLYTDAGLPQSYTAPEAGTSAATTRLSWNPDHQLASMTTADGTITNLTYDAGGRLANVSSPAGALTYSYLPTGQVASASRANAATVNYTWDGSLVTSMSWSGSVSAAVAFSFDSNLRVSTETVSGSPITFGYDDDGLLARAGALSVARDASNGLITGSALATATDSRTYTPNGEPQSYVATVAGADAFSEQFSRDDAGRIANRAETICGTTAQYEYGYDDAGRLVRVTRNGDVVAAYTYDANGNRLTKTTPAGTETGTYDDQDRLLSYGNATYTYTGGVLSTKNDPNGLTTYRYDTFGNLLSVTKPDGTLIEYVIDGQNRRVGKKVNGILVRQWVYANQLQIIAELDGTGALVNRLVYATRTNVPDYLIHGGVTYRVISDQLGSPRSIVDAQTGSIAQMLGFDEFGNVLSDSNPAFQPLGYAGGLYDPDTGLVRFGARDYDPRTGRWTSKDPLLFAGNDANVYAYVGGDPINHVDPSGLSWADTLMTTTSNVFAGFGDAISKVITLGFWSTKDLRDWENDALGAQNVEECSTSYTVGKYAGYAEATATMWAAGLNGGARSVFWSGAKLGAAEVAEQVGGVTLQQTATGATLTAIDNLLSKVGWGLPQAVWNAASATFAANAAEATAVIRAAGEGWSIEQRILEWRGIVINVIH